MKTNKLIFKCKSLLSLLFLSTLVFVACDDDDNTSFEEEARMFRPVLNENLFAEGNEIIVNMGKLKSAESYNLEVSRDTFATIDYSVSVDTSYVRINRSLVGEELFWNAIYQVRGQAIHENSNFNSRPADFGNVRTEKFPSILISPTVYDVTDIAALVNWELIGESITKVIAYAGDDLKLSTPLLTHNVTGTDQNLGKTIVEGLEPSKTYQLAIYSGDTLRGWENFTTLSADIDPNGADVIDLRDATSSSDLQTALSTAPEGAILLVSHGSEHIIDAPTPINSSFTVRAALGFGPQKARVFMPANFDLEPNAVVDHIRFNNVELRGSDWSSKYVMNVSKPGTINEVRFDNCFITNHRGVFRIKTNGVTMNNYIINESIVDSIGSYAVVTQDKNGSVLNNISLTKSTFNHLQYYFIVSRNNSERITIEDCTIANFSEGNGNRQFFRYREAGQNQVTGGINIINTIIGRAWDWDNDENYDIIGIDGLDQTIFNVSNSFSTTDLSFSRDPVPNLPLGNAGSNQENLWVDPTNNNFHFENKGFIGRTSAGDPRWREEF